MTGDVQADKPVELRLKQAIACSVADCGSLQVARGWCMSHYNRWHDHGDPLYVYVKPQAPSSCSVANCAKPHYTRAMCAAHYQQWRKYGDPLHRTRLKQPEQCEAADCDRRPVSLGYCTLHEQRLRKHGSVDLPARMTLEQRFWAKVNKDGPTPKERPELGPCWVWVGTISSTSGYGNFQDRQVRRATAHRWSYEFAIGPIPDGLEVDHLCRNRVCVRPAHLEPVTRGENQRRAWRARRKPA